MIPTDFTYQFYSTTSKAWAGMYQAVVSAKKSIFWEVYIFLDEGAGERFVDILCQKALVGVEVKIIIDSFGSFFLSRTAETRLLAAGVKIQHFNPFFLDWNIGKWINRIRMRNHRKVLIIDEEVVFLGGVNLDAASASWDDIHVRLTGKTVRLLVRGFAKNYVRSGGKKFEVRHLLHPKIITSFKKWQEKTHFIFHSPGYGKKELLQKLYLGMMGAANESITLLTPYYTPDKKFLELIRAAKNRGVTINILLPWRPDSRFMRLMADTYLEVTHRAGAAIYFLKKMNHGKAVTIDKHYGMIGSVNLTGQSFWRNEEANVIFEEQGMIEELNHILDNWKKEATPWSELRKKGFTWPKRLLNRFVSWFHGYV